MKITLTFVLTYLLIFAAPLSQALAEEQVPAVTDSCQVTWDQGAADGKRCADEHVRSTKWFFYGLGGGFSFGVVGGVITFGLSQAGSPKPPPQEIYKIAGATPDYQTAFGESYGKCAKRKAFVPALIGGAIGAAAAYWVVSSWK